MIRLLKPLEYYQQRYGTWMYALNKLYLMMEDAVKKPTSMVADFAMIPQAMTEALAGRQIQPILL